MDRSLPMLIAQVASCSASDPEAEFANDLQVRVTPFPQTQFVVYPELHLNPVTDPAGMEAAAEAIPGPRSGFLCELAARLGVWLLPGTVYERAADGRIHNTAIVISPRGEIVARYRKCFPWRPWESSVPGDSFTVFDVPKVGCFGLSICYDTWFPEVARHLAWMGAEVILQPSLTPTADRAQELVLARAAAIANQVFIVNVNAAAPSATGRSIVIDPEGNVLLLAGEAPASLTQVLDLSAVERVRRFGTAGLNRPWSQMRDGDPLLPMPLYGGEIDPSRWHPQAIRHDAQDVDPSRSGSDSDGHGRRPRGQRAEGALHGS
jgi:predicted amidohydrolase